MSESNDLNSHGDVAVKYEYLSGAGSRDDWYLASYYIYDYDGIDPYVVMQSKNLPASYLWEKVYADALRKGSALNPRLAQAYLDVLPEDDEANSRFFVSAAFADLNADEIPEMICITKSVSEPYGFEITSVEMTIYTAEGDKARQLYQGEIFAYGGTMTGTCRLFQTESSADHIVYSMDPTGAEEVLAYEVLSYKDGAIEEWKIYSVQSYYSDKGGPEFYRNGEPISRELYDQYAEPLQTPVANEIYHGSPNDNEMLWPDFFGDWRVTGLTRAAAVRVLTEAGAVP